MATQAQVDLKAEFKSRLEEARRGELALVLNFGLGLMLAGVILSLLANLFAPRWSYEATIIGTTATSIGVTLVFANRFWSRSS